MPSYPTRRWRSLLVGMIALALTTTLMSCGSDERAGPGRTDSTELLGITRATPLEVGSISLPDATVGGTGDTFRFRSAPGELLVVYFGYTSCPDVCPTTLADLRAARELLGGDGRRIDLAMITVDPERDAPERLSAYLASFADRYHAIRTTDLETLRAAEQAFGASSRVDRLPDGTVEVAHSATTYVVDTGGTVLVEWPFGTPPEDMAHDLRLLLEGASA
ncbi:SCO family protein [Rhabdothermincola sediminis]|uniref:SCO family protein n=1 Tax=Rhabdothermincola sediminis TaxID=2751370 RepID=UPI001AA05E6D|nr:SCO family protein [Rhabdothermincola sediminis]